MLKQISNDKNRSIYFSFRAILSNMLLIILIFSPLIRPAFGQQAITVEQLKQQISLLESINTDTNTSTEIKTINQKLLLERRNQLHELLKHQLDSMKEYFSKVQSALSEKEKLSMSELIVNLENDLNSIEPNLNTAKQDSLSINPNYLASTKPVFTSKTNIADSQTRIIKQRPANNESLIVNKNISTKSVSANLTNGVLTQSNCYPDAPPELITEVKGVAQKIVEKNDPQEFTGRSLPIFFFSVVAAMAVDNEIINTQKGDFENKIKIERLKNQIKVTNKQIGSTASSEGTTSAIEKPDFAELLGFALENGAIQKAVNGTTLTLSTSPYSFVTATQGGDTATNYKNYSYLSRLGVSATFNIANQDNVLLNASRKQLSEWNLRLRLSGDKSDRSEEAEAIWDTDVRQKFAAPAMVLTRTFADLFKDRALEDRRREIEGDFLKIASVSVALNDNALTKEQKINEIADLILCQIKLGIVDKVRSGEFRISSDLQKKIIDERRRDYSQAISDKEAEIKKFEEKLKTLTFKPTFTLAYTNKREVSSSDYSTFKILFEKKIEKKLNWTANAGFSVYHKPNAMLHQKQYRDFAVAFSFEGLLNRSPFLSEELDESPITYSFTGSYQRLFENKGIANKKADIGAGQFKLVFPIFTGFSIPFSVTYSNATPELRKAGVRANFGITLDTDKVFQVLKLKKLKTP